MTRLTATQRGELAAAIAAGDLYQDIAARFSIDPNTVTYHAKRLGYSPRNRHRKLVLPQILPERLAELLDSDPVPLRGTPEWMEAGACRGIDDPDVMYPTSERYAAPAKAICKRCPVKQICLEWALATREPHGVWGGLSELDRRHLTHPTTDTITEEETAC